MYQSKVELVNVTYFAAQSVLPAAAPPTGCLYPAEFLFNDKGAGCARFQLTFE